MKIRTGAKTETYLAKSTLDSILDVGSFPSGIVPAVGRIPEEHGDQCALFVD